MSSRGDREPDHILAEYLDELLSVSEDSSPWADEPVSGGQEEREGGTATESMGLPRRKRAGARRPQRAAVRVAEKPASSVSLVSPAFREVAPEAPAEPEPESESESERAPNEAAPPAPQTQPESVSQEAAVGEPEPWQQERPPWAQEGFECLIFRVAGLQLAVPLVLLGQIHRLDRELTPLVGRPDWFMGLLRVGNQNVRVTDTALWVMPERYRREFRDGYRFVIQLGDSAWGLACDEVAQSFRVQPDEVKWRSQGGRRQWLAGTIRKEMCALLDVARMAELLEKAETERHPDLDR